MPVPLLDLRRQYAPLKDQFLAAIEEVCDSQALVLGPKTEAFERAVAEYVGVPHAIGVSSGTDAELMILMALGIGPGDVVVTTPYTFFATASCIARLGARPVFVDIDPETYNIDVSKLAEALETHKNAKAIIPVHLFGQCAGMERILEIGRIYEVPVIEDAAQALGARHALGAAGAMGRAGFYSFYPTKNLGAFGDAGMIVCHDDALAAKLRTLRNHGMEPRYYHSLIGGNFRIDALQSAILHIKLPHLDTWSAGRRERAGYYRWAFAERGVLDRITLPVESWADSGVENHHIYNQFVIRVPRRDFVRAALNKAGIGTEVYYPLPLHEQECFQYLGYRRGSLPEAETAARETLALPIFPELTREEQQQVVDQVVAALS
jgi:dTDP-4-amino-4,6-dideoxygalactose transaminase